MKAKIMKIMRMAVPIAAIVAIFVIIWLKEKAATPLPPARPTAEHIAEIERIAAENNRKLAEKKAAEEKLAAEKKEAAEKRKADADKKAAEKKEREERLAAERKAKEGRTPPDKKTVVKPVPAVKTVRYIVFREIQLPIEGFPKAGESFMERRERLVTDAVGKIDIPDSSKIIAVEGGYVADDHGVGGEYTLITYELETIPAAESHRIPHDHIVPGGYSDNAVEAMARDLWEKQQDRSVVHTITGHQTQSMSNGRYTTHSNSTHTISATYRTRR